MINGKGVRTAIFRDETPEEVAQRVLEDKRKADSEAYKKQHTETLACDACGLSMGRVYAGDLEGSRFYHDHCI